MLFTAAADRGEAGDAGENVLQVLATDHRGADCHAAGDDVLPCRDVERGAGGRAFRSNLLESARNSGAGYRPAGDELSSAAGYDCANRLAAGEHVLIARIVLTEDHRADRRAGRKDILPAAAPDRGANRDTARDDLNAAAGDDGADLGAGNDFLAAGQERAATGAAGIDGEKAAGAHGCVQRAAARADQHRAAAVDLRVDFAPAGADHGAAAGDDRPDRDAAGTHDLRAAERGGAWGETKHDLRAAGDLGAEVVAAGTDDLGAAAEDQGRIGDATRGHQQRAAARHHAVARGAAGGND